MISRRGCRIAGATLTVALIAACGRTPAPTPPPKPPPPLTQTVVQPVPPPQMEAPILPEMVAELKGASEVPVVTKQSGYLLVQAYKGNPDVKEGDLLFLIDPRASHSDAPISEADPALIRITAPVSGVAGPGRHGAGDYIKANEVLATISSIDNVRAEVNLPDDLYQKFSAYLADATSVASAPTMRIELILPDGSVYPEKGIIDGVERDGSERTLRVSFPNPQHTLQPGEFMKVRSAKP